MAESYGITWAPAALGDLNGILEYISIHDSPSASAHVYSTILGRTYSLALHPMRCRIAPEPNAVGITEYRELVVAPYRILFHIKGRVVGLVGVFDGRRNLEEILLARVLSSH